MSHVLRSKKTVNLKDLESPQGHRMKKSTSKNETSDVSACGIKGSSNVLLSTKRKKDMGLKCYVNNAKCRRTQTSEDLGFQVCYDWCQQNLLTVLVSKLKLQCAVRMPVFSFC